MCIKYCHYNECKKLKTLKNVNCFVWLYYNIPGAHKGNLQWIDTELQNEKLLPMYRNFKDKSISTVNIRIFPYRPLSYVHSKQTRYQIES